MLVYVVYLFCVCVRVVWDVVRLFDKLCTFVYCVCSLFVRIYCGFVFVAILFWFAVVFISLGCLFTGVCWYCVYSLCCDAVFDICWMNDFDVAYLGWVCLVFVDVWICLLVVFWLIVVGCWFVGVCGCYVLRVSLLFIVFNSVETLLLFGGVFILVVLMLLCGASLLVCFDVLLNCLLFDYIVLFSLFGLVLICFDLFVHFTFVWIVLFAWFDFSVCWLIVLRCVSMRLLMVDLLDLYICLTWMFD